MYITGKKARSYVNQYNRTYIPLTLDDVYKSYSIAKHHAWEYCQRKCESTSRTPAVRSSSFSALSSTSTPP